jgi:para-aminobenzoate synthetase component I
MTLHGKEIIEQMNRLGSQAMPFVFIIDFEGKNPIVLPVEKAHQTVLWKTPGASNIQSERPTAELRDWRMVPEPFEIYRRKFNSVMQHILNGDTYLLNLTQPTPIETNLNIEEIFYLSRAPYKVLLKNNFVCFSPEPFIRIENGQISSFPMKGTKPADTDKAGEYLLADSKELAEHNTIVDLIRNDLSLVAENVRVDKFRYLERIQTNQKDLWQVSSKITGQLPEDYPARIGEILFKTLPAGSVTGAPKKKTVEIIKNTEQYQRGYYTGVFGYFDGKNLDSCVLIRYIENQNGRLIYKSGGGITFMSQPETEYNEMLNKVYVPVV